MIPVTFKEVHSSFSGQLLGYEPVNFKAKEVVDFMEIDPEKAIPVSRAEKIMDWLESLGLEINIIETK